MEMRNLSILLPAATALLLGFQPHNSHELSTGAGNPPKTKYFLQEGSAVGFHFIKYREPYGKAENEQFLRTEYFPNWRDLMPGSRVYYLMGERGARAERGVFCWVFQSAEARDNYFPQRDESTPAYQELRKTIDWLYTDQKFYKHNAGWEGELSADYMVIAAGKPVKKDWMRPGAIIGMHPIALKNGVDSDAFEQFIKETWAPARSDAVPGAKGFFLKGIRGDQENEYVFMWVFRSHAVRDKYFPEPDRPSAAYQKRSKKWEWINGDAHLGRFLETGNPGEQTDFALVQ